MSTILKKSGEIITNAIPVSTSSTGSTKKLLDCDKNEVGTVTPSANETTFKNKNNNNKTKFSAVAVAPPRPKVRLRNTRASSVPPPLPSSFGRSSLFHKHNFVQERHEESPSSDAGTAFASCPTIFDDEEFLRFKAYKFNFNFINKNNKGHSHRSQNNNNNDDDDDDAYLRNPLRKIDKINNNNNNNSGNNNCHFNSNNNMNSMNHANAAVAVATSPHRNLQSRENSSTSDFKNQQQQQESTEATAAAVVADVKNTNDNNDDGNSTGQNNNDVTTNQLEITPASPEELFNIATAFEEEYMNEPEKFPEIVAAFEKCYVLDPCHNKEAAKQKYLHYFKLQLEREHCGSNKNQEELKQLGNAQFQQDRFEEAVIMYTAAIDIDPISTSAALIYSNRSLCFMNLGRFQEAYDDGDMAAALQPEFARGHLRRANAAMKLEKWKDALDSYNKVDADTARRDGNVEKNRNLANKFIEKQEAENRRRHRLLEKTRNDLMSIEDEQARKVAVWNTFFDQQRNPSTFCCDIVRVTIECGIDLGVMHRTSREMARRLQAYPQFPEKYSVLTGLLAIRREISSKILPQFDRLVLFIIDRMSKERVDFVGVELCEACAFVGAPLNSAVVCALVQTEKFDLHEANDGFLPPIFTLLASLECGDSVPSALLDCIHLFRSTKKLDVNRRWTRRDDESGRARHEHLLQYVTHPEIARVLLRNGLDIINGVSTHTDGSSVNALQFAAEHPLNPHLEELVRLYTANGATLLENGKDNKSSSAMWRIFAGIEDAKSKKRVHVSEDIFVLYLHLNSAKQQLEMRWQSWKADQDWTFLSMAVMWSPARFVEIVYAQNPAALSEPKITDGSKKLSVVGVLAKRITHVAKSLDEFEECMRVLEVLLVDAKLDLLETDKFDASNSSHFKILWDAAGSVSHEVVKLLRKTIVAKRDKEEFQKCVKTSNQLL